jgi:thymidylate synthase ThyX
MKKVGPDYFFSDTENPDLIWKTRLLEARHSPIRVLQFVLLIENVPYWVHTHLVRHHIGCDWFVTTSRNDRQKEFDRTKATQDHPVNLVLCCNAEALINICQKRLCMRASKETRELVTLIRDRVLECSPEFGSVLVKPCEYGKCHELKPCRRQNEA